MRRVLVVLGMLAILATAGAQELRAWMDLNFGDSPEVVHEKMERMLADRRIGPTEFGYTDSFTGTIGYDVLGQYGLSIAGVQLLLEPAYQDGSLYWIQFLGRYRSANFWDSAVMSEVATLRDVLVGALGSPTESYDVRVYDLAPYSAQALHVWRGQDGITRFLGVREGQYEYAPVIVIQLDEVAQRIAVEREEERQRELQDASEGF